MIYSLIWLFDWLTAEIKMNLSSSFAFSIISTSEISTFLLPYYLGGIKCPTAFFESLGGIMS